MTAWSQVFDLSLHDCLRLITIIGGYLLLRPVIMAVFGKGKKEDPVVAAEESTDVHPMAVRKPGSNDNVGWGRRRHAQQVRHMGTASKGAFDADEDADIREFLED